MPVLGPNDYSTMVDLIADAFNTQSSNISTMLASYGADNAYDAFKLLEQTPYSIIYSYDGSVNAYSYSATASKVINETAGSVNSNVETLVRADMNLPVSTTYVDPTSPISGPKYEVGPRTAPAASAGSTVMAVLDKVALGVMGVSIGAKLGAFIDEALYNAAPDFWDYYAPTINPETWGSMAVTEGGKSFINALFGINGDQTTPYVPADSVAYFALLMQQQGFFNTGENEYPDTPSSGTVQTISSLGSGVSALYDGLTNLVYTSGYNIPDSILATMTDFCSDNCGYMIIIRDSADAFSGSSPIRIYKFSSLVVGASFTEDANYSGVRLTTTGRKGSGYEPMNVLTVNLPSGTASQSLRTGISRTDPYIYISNINVTEGSGDLPAGVTHQPGAQLPSLSNDDTPATADEKLRRQFPSWYNNPIYLPTQQPDGSIKDTPFIPLPFVPNPDMRDNPTNNPDNDNYVDQNSDPTVDPETSPDSLIETIFRYLNPNPPETTPPDPDTGEGTSPAVVIPTGNASSLWSVYNPTQAQVNAFGAWLWSSDFIDQIAKLFLQPMDAIVGIHKIFAPPILSGSSTIVCGYLDSEVPSAVVGNQYTYVDCGTVRLSEYFGNVFDYSPYTSVRIYLPFIGVVPLDVADVMRASINVRYGVDVITGACLAMVKVTRDGESGGVLYQYGGSCAVHYPHSSGSYMGIIGGIVGLAASALSMIGGGPLGTAIGGLHMASQAMNAHASYQVGGSFSGEPGAMGGKKPYLIISRPQPKVAAAVESFMGYPANYTSNLNGVKGFIRVSSCHVQTIKNATDTERIEIERHLKDGVIIA